MHSLAKLPAFSWGVLALIGDASQETEIRWPMRCASCAIALKINARWLDFCPCSVCAGTPAYALNAWLSEGVRRGYFNGTKDSFSLKKRLVSFAFDRPLDDPQALGVLAKYLLHRIESEAKGDPFLIFVDEFRRYLESPIFAGAVQRMLQEYRKLNGVFVAAVQAAGDVFNHEVGRKNLANFATYILFASPSAEETPYREGFRLTPEEFAWVKGVHPYQVLVKQGEHSLVLKVDLSPLGDLLKVYDSSREAVTALKEGKTR